MTFDQNKHPRGPGGQWAETPDAADDADDAKFNAMLARTAQKDKDENARRVKLAADRVAVDLGYDPSLIKIEQGERKFTLNGKLYDYAGAAYITGPRTGDIELFSEIISPSSIPEVTAHEIGHQKFQRWVNDYQAEYKRMTDETKDIDVDTYMKPSGLLRDGFAEKYPLYQKYTEVMMPSILEDFSKTDGITDYSKEWWKAWHDQKANTSQAMHETLAEMTARDYVVGPTYETESEKFKAAGYSLDYGREYSVRKWKGEEVLDPATLPPDLKKSFGELQKANADKSLRRNASKYGKPAKEWVALYDAIKDHWEAVKNVPRVLA